MSTAIDTVQLTPIPGASHLTTLTGDERIQ